MMSKKIVLAASVLIIPLSCMQKTENKGSAKHYHLTGTIQSVNPKEQTASIDAAAIPNYMEAMTMSYPIADKSEMETLHAGDHIEATVNVFDSGDYNLSAIKKVGR